MMQSQWADFARQDPVELYLFLLKDRILFLETEPIEISLRIC